MKDLTQPRYLVIADYPNSPFNVGNILTQYTQFNKTSYWVNDNLYTDRHPEDYPHLFRLLHWWEYRDEKEMPEYVKHQDKIYKVTGWRDNSPYYEGGKHPFAPEVVTPATLSEYNEYIKTK